jgi:hypothetical protein
MHDTLLIIFTGVLAAAILMQAFLFFGIYKSVRRLTVWMEGLGKDLTRNAEIVSSKVDESLVTIKGIANSVKPISDRLTDTTEIIQKRVLAMDDFLAETTRTAQLEILRIQDTIQIVTRGARETVELLRTSILTPVNEINAITRALRTGFDMFFRRSRNLSSSSAHDEEMFI